MRIRREMSLELVFMLVFIGVLLLGAATLIWGSELPTTSYIVRLGVRTNCVRASDARVEFDVPVPREFYDSVRVGSVIAWKDGSAGTWQVTVQNKLRGEIVLVHR